MKRSLLFVTMMLLCLASSLAQKKKTSAEPKPKTTKTVAVKRQHQPVSERQGMAPDMPIKYNNVGSKYGFVTLDGKEVCPAEFDNANKYTGGLFKVKMDGKEYLIDSSGRSLLKDGSKFIFQYDRLICSCDASGNYTLYNLDGAMVGGRPFTLVSVCNQTEDAGALNVTYNSRTTAIDFEGNLLPGVFQNEECDIELGVTSSINKPWFYSLKLGILNANGEVMLDKDKAKAYVRYLSEYNYILDYKFYEKNKLNVIFESYKEFTDISFFAVKNDGYYNLYDLLGNYIIRHVKASNISGAIKKGKKQILAYLNDYPEYRKQIEAKYYEPYRRLMEKKKNLPAYADFCEGPSMFDVAKERQRASLAAAEKVRREELAREAAEKKAREAEERKRQKELAAAAKRKTTTSTSAQKSTASAKTVRSDGYSPNAVNKAYGNHTDLDKTNHHYSVPAFGTVPLGDYYYLCSDGYATHIEITNYQGNIEACSYDGHFITADKFRYDGTRGDWLYFYGINITTHNKWGEMEMYIAKDWSKVVLTTSYGNIFDQQCSEYTATMSFKTKNMKGWGYTNAVNLSLTRASEARTQMLLQDIQNTINSTGTSQSSGTYSTPSHSNTGIRVKEYTPNYTGSSEQRWCDECHGYDAPHYHYNKR